MPSFQQQQQIAGHIKEQTQFEQAQNQAGTLGLSGWEFKTTVINM